MIKIGKVKLGVRPTICVVLQDSFGSNVIRRLKRSAIQLVELRIDQFKRFDFPYVLAKIKALKRKEFSIIGTIRVRGEGGAWKFSEMKRLLLFKQILPFVHAIDVELKSKIRSAVVREAHRRSKIAVVSFHDFRRTPSEKQLMAHFKKAKRADADIVKIAVLAKKRADFSMMMNFTIAHRRQGLISISMGHSGKASRILFPLFGSLMTYGCVGRRTAPGQLSVEELREALKL